MPVRRKAQTSKTKTVKTRPNKVRIRRADLQDAKDIHEAHMRSIREICAKDYTNEEINAWAGRAFNEEIRHKNIKEDLVWVVEDEGKVHGFAHMQMKANREPGEAYVTALYLSPEVVGKGVGKRLLELMEDEAKAANVNCITLQSTITALPFYRKLGFAEAGEQEKYDISGVGIRCYPMKKEF